MINQPDEKYTTELVKLNLTKDIQETIVSDIREASKDQKKCYNVSNIFSVIAKILFFLSNILSFVSAYLDNKLFSLIAGCIGIIGLLFLQYSMSATNETNSNSIKLIQMLKYFNVDVVPNITVEQKNNSFV